jgi:hypothetical protein
MTGAVSSRYPTARRWAYAWAALTLAFALHVVDEATHDFLSWYNPTVLSLRDRLGWFPMPTFEQGVWLVGLIVAVLALFALTPWVARGRRWLVPLAYVYASVHVLNGLGHLGISAYTRQWIPGVLSSPLLLAAGAWLLIETSRVRRLGYAPNPP